MEGNLVDLNKIIQGEAMLAAEVSVSSESQPWIDSNLLMQ
jgi:hypothetical protein